MSSEVKEVRQTDGECARDCDVDVREAPEAHYEFSDTVYGNGIRGHNSPFIAPASPGSTVRRLREGWTSTQR